jgi:poly(3-hydroxyalkanoate) synthetase
MQSFAPGGDLAFYRGLVAAGGGMLSGEAMLSGFIAIQPDNEIARQFALLANVNDPAHVERYQEFEDWFKHTQAIPGQFYLWIVEHLFRDNRLISGELEIGGQRVDVRQIRCPLNLLAGATDHITPPSQVFALADYAPRPQAATSGCSWATRRCASTGRRCWPRSRRARCSRRGRRWSSYLPHR